eukprot:CAMPEP_0184658028 /NCGR_PEP_ID=MMETSP0308-20130426/23333_1 /TAXON_ID=38269 /ORGANISM="Gloeochaete witrockiana, Strain SAG 46.84" /LENGTH=557 /DNA_ID=CAMNT_0027096603 /DNA_START=209 /DNA_END=1882 /DNA_ORIENTATION=+
MNMNSIDQDVIPFEMLDMNALAIQPEDFLCSPGTDETSLSEQFLSPTSIIEQQEWQNQQQRQEWQPQQQQQEQQLLQQQQQQQQEQQQQIQQQQFQQLQQLQQQTKMESFPQQASQFAGSFNLHRSSTLATIEGSSCSTSPTVESEKGVILRDLSLPQYLSQQQYGRFSVELPMSTTPPVPPAALRRRASADHAHSPMSFPGSDDISSYPSSQSYFPNLCQAAPPCVEFPPATARMGRRGSADQVFFRPGASPPAAARMARRASADLASLPVDYMAGDFSPASHTLKEEEEEDENSELPPHRRIKQKGNPNRLRRPQNAFIMFSNYARKHLKLAHRNTMSTMEISRALGAQWRALSKSDRKYFEDLAEKTRAEFKAAHPEFRYSATRKKSKQLKAGDVEEEAHAVSLAPATVGNGNGYSTSNYVPPARAAVSPAPFQADQHRHSMAASSSLPNVGNEVQRALEEVRRLFGAPSATQQAQSSEPVPSPEAVANYPMMNEGCNGEPYVRRRLTVPSFSPGAVYVPVTSDNSVPMMPYYLGGTNVASYYFGPNVSSYYLA